VLINLTGFMIVASIQYSDCIRPSFIARTRLLSPVGGAQIFPRSSSRGYLRPDAYAGQRMKKSENIQKP
jgi:hypothetical protein